MLMLIYYNGRTIDDEGIENGVRYSGPHPKSMVIKRGMTRNGLKEYIYIYIYISFKIKTCGKSMCQELCVSFHTC